MRFFSAKKLPVWSNSHSKPLLQKPFNTPKTKRRHHPKTTSRCVVSFAKTTSRLHFAPKKRSSPYPPKSSARAPPNLRSIPRASPTPLLRMMASHRVLPSRKSWTRSGRGRVLGLLRFFLEVHTLYPLHTLMFCTFMSLRRRSHVLFLS